MHRKPAPAAVRPTGGSHRIGRAVTLAALALAATGLGGLDPAGATPTGDSEGIAPTLCAGHPDVTWGYPGLTEKAVTTADLDGDGERQPVALDREGTTAIGHPIWRLTSVVRNGRVIQGTFEGDTPAGRPAVSAADFDGDGDEDLIITEDSGRDVHGPSEMVKMFGLQGCGIVPVAPDDGTAIEFLLEISDAQRSTVTCSYDGTPTLTHFASWPAEPGMWKVVTTTYRWSDLHLSETRQTEQVMTQAEFDRKVPTHMSCGRPTSAQAWGTALPPDADPAPAPTTTKPQPVTVKPHYTG